MIGGTLDRAGSIGGMLDAARGAGKPIRVLFSPKDDWEPAIRESLEGSRYVPTFSELTDEALHEADVVLPLRVPDMLRAVDSPDAARKAFLPTREAILTANDKMAFNAFLIEDGFDMVVPEIYRSERSYPYILKPSIGEWGSDIEIVNGPEDEAPLSARLESPTFFAQRYIEGHEEHTAHLIFDGKSIRYADTVIYTYAEDRFVKGPNYKQVRYERASGCIDELLFATILLDLGFRGVAAFNYKVSDGVPWILELNPRFGGSAVYRMKEMLDVYVDCIDDAARPASDALSG